jgi:hypothetical protein
MSLSNRVFIRTNRIEATVFYKNPFFTDGFYARVIEIYENFYEQ